VKLILKSEVSTVWFRYDAPATQTGAPVHNKQ